MHDPGDQVAAELCKAEEGCSRPARVRGLCQRHYSRNYRQLHPRSTSTERRCSADDCGRQAVARGLCNRHWRQQRKQGFPDAPRARQPQTGKCSVGDCDTPARLHGMCGMHEKRQRRNGDPLVVQRVRRRPLQPPSEESNRGA